MASGKLCAAIIRDMPTADGPNASLGVLLGATTIGEQIPTLDFDDTTIEYWDYLIDMESYDAGGLTVTLKYSAAASSGDVDFECAFRRIGDDIEDIDTTAHTYNFNTATTTVPSVIGEIGYHDVVFTDGVDIDSIADGELGILRIRRNSADTLVGDASLISVLIRET